MYDFILMLELNVLLFVFVPYVAWLYLTGERKMRTLSRASVFRDDEPES